MKKQLKRTEGLPKRKRKAKKEREYLQLALSSGRVAQEARNKKSKEEGAE